MRNEYYNAEHYHDPTAGQAIENLARDKRRRRKKHHKRKRRPLPQPREIPMVRPEIKEVPPCSKP